MQKPGEKYLIPLLLTLAAAAFFIPFIGRMHLFDWDEINFAECAREMIVSKNYLTVQIDFRPFWEKPPLFIWMQVLSMKAFGINEFAARLPDALCGVFTLLVIFLTGRKLKDVRFGLWWVLIYAASILPQFYFRSGIIDPWFNLFIFTSVWFLACYSDPFAVERKKSMYAALSGLMIGLAVLTKGPTALLILGLVIVVYYFPHLYKYFTRKKRTVLVKVKFTDVALFVFIAALSGGFWFLLQIMNGHADMVVKFILYQVRLFTIPDAGHGGHWSYHFWVLLFGVFPASVFAMKSFRLRNDDHSLLTHFQLLMLILFWVVLILFSIVKTKIIHYSSLCYFPLSFLATLSVMDLIEGKTRLNKGLKILLTVMASVISLLVIALPVVVHYKQAIIDSGLIRDAFAVANLQADVHWSGFESLIGMLLITGTIASLILMKNNIRRALIVLFTSSLLFTWSMQLVFPYRIEQYSQRAAIEFFQSKSGENCYVLNAGYFSYAPLFYGNKMPDDVKRPLLLLTGHTDRPFYLVMKEPEYEKWKHLVPAMKELYRKNGFVFLRYIK